jgi:hypothetical protein
LNLTDGTTVDYAGTFTGSGAGTVALTNGTLAVAGGGATFNLPGSLFQWTGGVIDVTHGNMTDASTGLLNLDTSSNNLGLNGAGKLTNQGAVNLAGGNSLLLEDSATLSNVKGATFDITADGTVTESGGGTLTNAGTVEKAGGTGTSFISCLLSNKGTADVNTGTLVVNGAVTQVSAGTLTAGKWVVNGTASVPATLDISSASFTTIGKKAGVSLNGGGATFTNLGSVETNDGSFSLLGGQSFTVPNETTTTYVNNGKLTLGPGSQLHVGNVTEASTATLTVQIGGTSASPIAGSSVEDVASPDAISIGGTLKLALQKGVKPPVGSVLSIITGLHSGNFTGLPEGSTITLHGETYKISYSGGSVTLTRVS